MATADGGERTKTFLSRIEEQEIVKHNNTTIRDEYFSGVFHLFASDYHSKCIFTKAASKSTYFSTSSPILR